MSDWSLDANLTAGDSAASCTSQDTPISQLVWASQCRLPPRVLAVAEQACRTGRRSDQGLGVWETSAGSCGRRGGTGPNRAVSGHIGTSAVPPQGAGETAPPRDSSHGGHAPADGGGTETGGDLCARLPALE